MRQFGDALRVLNLDSAAKQRTLAAEVRHAGFAQTLVVVGGVGAFLHRLAVAAAASWRSKPCGRAEF
jgi:hypothetical protein